MKTRYCLVIVGAIFGLGGSVFGSQSPNFTAQLTGNNGDLLIKVTNLPVFNAFEGTSITDKATGTAVTNFYVTITDSTGKATVISSNANLSFAFKVTNNKRTGVSTDKGKAFSITSDDSKTQIVFKVDVSAAIEAGAIPSASHGKSSKPSLANVSKLSITFANGSLIKTFNGTPGTNGKIAGGP